MEKSLQKKSAVTSAKAEMPATESKSAAAVKPAASTAAGQSDAVTKLLGKQRVKIKLPGVAKPRPAKAAATPTAEAVPFAATRKAARVPAAKSRKPAAQRQRIKVSKPRASKPALVVPPVLLEGDEPARSAAPSGPGSRYALGPSAPPAHAARFDEAGELPEAYGTQKLLLAARDPHWLYAHWDFTREQLRRLNALSADGHLVLRVFTDRVAGEPLVTQHVHPESKSWFVFVGRGGTRFVAELGYRSVTGAWVSLTTSRRTLTPPDTMSDDTTVTFANLPVEVPFDQILDVVKAAVSSNVPLLEALQQLRAEGFTKLPSADVFEAAAMPAATAWTREQQRALAEVITMDEVRRVWIGSLEITELVKRQLARDVSSAAAAQFSSKETLPTSPLGAVSSPSPRTGTHGRGFWFSINAELVIYGATEPDAAVAIGGRPITLRPDGTFSYRFALPDGQFELPVSATSADEAETRSADLHFSRVTHFCGDVAAHAQDASLKAPLAANVA